MYDQREAASAHDVGRLVQYQRGLLTGAPGLVAAGRDCLKATTAGVVGSVVLIANIVSFGALMFHGDLGSGVPTAIWAMLVGSCIGGLWIALSTSLPPLATGIDSPTVAVLALLSASAGSTVLASGGSPEIAVQTVMLIFTAATLMTGAALFGIGATASSSYFRFVPYFVVGGFLGATGWLLIAGGVRMTSGGTLAPGPAMWTGIATAKLATAVAVALVLLGIRRWLNSSYALPAALVVMWLTGAIMLQGLELTGPEHGWYFSSFGSLTSWSPFDAARVWQPTWSMAALVPELLAVTVVALVSLVTKVSAIELARQTCGDLDREFRGHGIASLMAAPFGGLTCNLQPATSQLLHHAAGTTRISGVVCALALGLIAVADLDLPGLIPIPIVAGILFYLGYNFIIDALGRLYTQRAWIDLLLAIAITVVCIWYGYLVGVLVGIVGACVLFAISYARRGVVRRHVTRTQFASYVDRSAEAFDYLRKTGDAIQLYWLSGYIFFGSSEGVFERIRSDIEASRPRLVAYVILDFGMVSGFDSSAMVSLAKLRNFCDQQGTTLVYCSLSPGLREVLERGGFFDGDSDHQACTDLNVALAACEDRLLANLNIDTAMDLAGFEAWLQQQVGRSHRASELIAYLDRRDAVGSQVLYREGEPADTVDLVAAGKLAIDIATENGGSLRVRQIMTHTVVGEMGFFRRSLRSATVSSDGPATLFTLTRANFERMRHEHPGLANAFADFIMRVLADRIDFANRAIATLSR